METTGGDTYAKEPSGFRLAEKVSEGGLRPKRSDRTLTEIQERNRSRLELAFAWLPPASVTTRNIRRKLLESSWLFAESNQSPCASSFCRGGWKSKSPAMIARLFVYL